MFSKQHRTVLGTLTTSVSKAKKPWYFEISISLVYAPRYASEQQQRPEMSFPGLEGINSCLPERGVHYSAMNMLFNYGSCSAR